MPPKQARQKTFILVDNDAGDAGGDAAEEFVGDGFGAGGLGFGIDGVFAAAAPEGDLVADMGFGHVAEVDHQAIHADAANLPHFFAVQFEDGAVGENAGHAVGVTSLDDTDAHGPLGGKDAAIADALPCCQFAHGADSGDEAHDGGELDLAAHKVVVDAAVKDNPGAAHIEGVGGLFDDGGAVGAVADDEVDAALLTALDDGHQAAELEVTVLRVLI